MKKYLVIGKPINHSLSPQLHNYWLKENNLTGVYDKEEFDNRDLAGLILKIKNNEINGVNITVPFKKEIISYLDKLSPVAEKTQSVNTVYLEKNKIVGHNTDANGFKLALKDAEFDVLGKKIFILGAGGVVSSIIFALQEINASNIILSNRTKSKAEDIKKMFNNLKVLDWGEIPDFDMIINATSVGLKIDDDLDLDFSKVEKGKFFYDVIYNPKETMFLKKGRELGCKTENGQKMFIYQAAEAFELWHGIRPKFDDKINKIFK